MSYQEAGEMPFPAAQALIVFWNLNPPLRVLISHFMGVKTT
jgi:hypothetical protein